jgi:hypothetical protein
MPDTVEQQPELKRVMGPGLLLLFIVGDILGTGVYALTGQVAGDAGGAAWLPFLIAFVIATITALSYLELVTKYPQAAIRAQGIRDSLLHVHRGLRGDVLGYHVGVDGLAGVRIESDQGLRFGLGQDRYRDGGAAVHGGAGRDQFPWRQ